MACRTGLRFRLDLIGAMRRRDGDRKADSENRRKEACDHDEIPPSTPAGPKCGRIPHSFHRENPMRAKLMLTLAATAAAMVFPPAIDAARAEGPAALTGLVSSDAEGKMEGVVVTARRAGSIVQVSVTTDAQGRYSFPRDRLEPGEYTLDIRAVDRWPYELKTLPRPRGRDTRAIVTQYDMVRPTTEPHDVLVDKEGKVWYTDFGEMFIGKFDPKSLKLVEYPIKKFKDKAPTGLLSIEFDHEGKIWFDTMYQGSLGSLDPKSGKIAYYPLPPEYNDDTVQLNFTGLRHDVDGKVWTKSVGTQHIFRLDLATNKWERFHPTDYLPESAPKNAGIYQVISDSQNNLWMAEFTQGHLGKIDAKTTKVTWWPFPTPNARGRRMNIDDQDRIVVTEYRGNKVAVFDTRAEKFTEYDLPPRTYPYRANFDRNGELWVSTMHTDRVVRLDPKTGTAVQYLMPSDTNMRTVFVDKSTTPTTFWVGSNHDHRLVKVEPLD